MRYSMGIDDAQGAGAVLEAGESAQVSPSRRTSRRKQVLFISHKYKQKAQGGKATSRAAHTTHGGKICLRRRRPGGALVLVRRSPI